MPSAQAVAQAASSLLRARDFDQAQPAAAPVRKPVEVAERGDVDAVLPRHLPGWSGRRGS